MKKTLVVSCVLVALPLVASADDPKKAPASGAPAVAPVPPPEPPKQEPPKPAAELEMLKGMLKSWSCTATNQANEKVTSKLVFKADLDKFWINVRMEVAKTKTQAAFTGTGFVGIDPVSKGWVFEGVDNMGGMIHLKAKAVTAEEMVFTGDASDRRGLAPAKFTFKPDAKTKHVQFVGEFGGKKAFDYDCK